MLLVVAVMASFLVLPAQALSAKDFTDVPAEAWFYEDVDFVTTHGYFIGRGNGIFAPDDMLTREELATILARLDGANLSNNNVSPYNDVEAGRWSAAAIQWMKNTRLTQGTGDGNFNPTGQLTRQELAVFVARFVDYYTSRHGYRLAPKMVVPEFPDLNDADEWARDSIETDRKNGLIYGFQDNCFYPKLTSTRAQIAAIIHRLVVELRIVITPTTTVIVTYDLNWPAGITGAPTNATRSGTTYTPYTPSAAETPTGYVFVGWNTKADGTGEDREVGTSYTTATSLTIYAQWLAEADLIGMGV
ncbi:MAG: S-layer homology domain-containing protein, partial [Oscillospiraceae bacterium]|nr:S-layer homology domain-containing protein [Oscillospiraceae bacterium]